MVPSGAGHSNQGEGAIWTKFPGAIGARVRNFSDHVKRPAGKTRQSPHSCSSVVNPFMQRFHRSVLVRTTT